MAIEVIEVQVAGPQGPPGPQGRVLLGKVYAAAGQAIAFTDIPQEYESLRLEWTARAPSPGGQTRTVTFNGDNSTSYWVSGSSTASSTGIPILAPQNGMQSGFLEIPGYNNTYNTEGASTTGHIAYGQSVGSTNAGNSNLAVSLLGGRWQVDEAITSITITPSANHPRGWFRLYGVN